MDGRVIKREDALSLSSGAHSRDPLALLHGHDEPVIANASDSVLAVRPRFRSLATIALLAGRINRRKDAVVDRASLSNQTSALEIGFRNELNDFAHAVPAMIQELGGIPAAPHASKPLLEKLHWKIEADDWSGPARFLLQKCRLPPKTAGKIHAIAFRGCRSEWVLGWRFRRARE